LRVYWSLFGLHEHTDTYLAVAVQTGPDDMQDGEDEQDGEGHIRADKGGGEDGGHDVEGERRGLGERGEEGGDGAGEGAEDEGSEAERPDVRGRG